mgnify:CR=1 FL=1
MPKTTWRYLMVRCIIYTTSRACNYCIWNARMNLLNTYKVKIILQEGWRFMKKITKIMRNNRGMGTVEMILIIVVLIGLVLIFKTQISDLVGNVFQKISADSAAILAWWGDIWPCFCHYLFQRWLVLYCFWQEMQSETEEKWDWNVPQI